jgi:hypothetical protein
MAKNSEAPATETAKRKGVQISANIRPELHAAIEDHRWDVRMKFSEVVATALEEYAANHNVTVEAPAE